jgi:hypothetical protein
VGGQMPLAMAAPDKREVEPVWSYRWQEVQALAVPVRTGIRVTPEAIKAYAPDFAVVAMGAAPRAAPFDLSAIDSTVRVLHAWDFLAVPERIAPVPRSRSSAVAWWGWKRRTCLPRGAALSR